MNLHDPENWVFVLPLIQFMGIKWLMAATDGYHHMGMVKIQTRKRWTALGAGMATIWVPYLLLWVTTGVGPTDLWGAAWTWFITFPVIGWAVGIFTWMGLLSPFQAILAIVLTKRALHKEQQRLITVY